MIILGIDPGVAAVGYGAIELKKKNDPPVVLDYGVIKTQAYQETAARLAIIEKSLLQIIKDWKPNIVTVESLYFFRNQKSIIGVSQVKGIILLTAERKGVPVYEFTPLETKLVVTGYGKASKEEMQKALQKRLKMQEIPAPDHAADALGVATCFLIKNQFLS